MNNQSLAGRAVAAVLLMIGFYLLAFAMAAGLLWIPYAEWHYAGRLHIKLALFSIIAGLSILWAVIPRPDDFEDPGPRLDPIEQKNLFAAIRDVSKQTGVTMPSEVFLVFDVNAWVAQRGGIMGFGSRRVMGIGLPLLQAVSVSQLKAILAHEFGHYHGGDTKLGPWIYKTRGAIGRTLATLGDEGIVHKPFEWYGKLFMRITQAISRRQELAADQLAARVGGARALADGLKATHRAALAFDSYWQNEVTPVLSAGFRPPIAEGFERFVSTGDIAGALDKDLDRELTSGEGDPYDSHPPLKDRLAALGSAASAPPPDPDPTATNLMRNLPSIEVQLLKMIGGKDAVEALKTLKWEETGETVFQPMWREAVAENREALEGIRVEDLPEIATRIGSIVGRFDLSDTPNQYKADRVRALIACGLAVRLADLGWSCAATPGSEVIFSNGSFSMEPFTVLSRMGSGVLTAEQWATEIGNAGLSGALA